MSPGRCPGLGEHRAFSPRSHALGFSLVELLVVVTIIGVLISLLLPAVQSAREAARRATCLNHLRQISIGLHCYHEVNGSFPTGCSDPGGKQIAWSVFLLPFIEQQNIHDLFHFDKNYTALINRDATHRIITSYLCPSTNQFDTGRAGSTTINNPIVARNGMGCTDYGGMYGWSVSATSEYGVLLYDKLNGRTVPPVKIADIRDGTSQTIIVAEDTGRGWGNDGEWSNGQNIFDQNVAINISRVNNMWSDHLGGVHAAFCDGSARFLSELLAVAVVKALCTRDGEEIIDGKTF